jgi:hypothetical protein
MIVSEERSLSGLSISADVRRRGFGGRYASQAGRDRMKSARRKNPDH